MDTLYPPDVYAVYRTGAEPARGYKAPYAIVVAARAVDPGMETLWVDGQGNIVARTGCGGFRTPDALLAPKAP